MRMFFYGSFGKLSEFKNMYMWDESFAEKLLNCFSCFFYFFYLNSICKPETYVHHKQLLSLMVFMTCLNSNRCLNEFNDFPDFEVFTELYEASIIYYVNLLFFSLSVVLLLFHCWYGEDVYMQSFVDLRHWGCHDHDCEYLLHIVLSFWWLIVDNDWRCWEVV